MHTHTLCCNCNVSTIGDGFLSTFAFVFVWDCIRSYVESINMLIDVYLAPLRAQATDVTHPYHLSS
jgi:hypothetical protein